MSGAGTATPTDTPAPGSRIPRRPAPLVPATIGFPLPGTDVSRRRATRPPSYAIRRWLRAAEFDAPDESGPDMR